MLFVYKKINSNFKFIFLLILNFIVEDQNVKALKEKGKLRLLNTKKQITPKPPGKILIGMLPQF